MEEAESRGYDYGYESAYENIYEDRQEKVEGWMDRFVTFLKDKWVNLNKEQIQEVEDYLGAYPIPE